MRLHVPSALHVSLIALGILVITAHMPLLQLIPLWVMSIIIPVSFHEGVTLVGTIVTGVISAALLVAYYLAKSQREKIYCLLATHLFFFPFLVMVIRGMFDSSTPYWLAFLVVGSIEGGVLLLVDVIVLLRSRAHKITAISEQTLV